MAVLGAIILFVAIFWIMTMVKIADNAPSSQEQTAPLKSGEVAIN